MTTTRKWTAATAAVCVLLILAAWFLLIAPKRAEATDLRDQTVAQRQANEQTKLRIQQLKAQYAELPAKQAELAVIKQQLPDNPALPTLIRSLSAMADSAGVTLVSIAPAAPATFVGATGQTTTVTAPTPAGSASTTTSTTTTTTPAPGNGVAPTGTAVRATTATQLLGIATTVVVRGDYAGSTLFLQKLQAASAAKTGSQLSRAFLVQSVKIAPDATSAASSTSTGGTTTTTTTTSTKAKGQVQTTIAGQVFVLKTAPIPTVAVPSAG